MEKVASSERAVERHEERLADLRARQNAHDAFAIQHATEFTGHRCVGR